MATNKNQHFVPRCYLRNFTGHSEGKVINLYNLDRDKFVEGAPTKNQCSRDYFYGKSPLLEEAIQTTERFYALAAREILSDGYQWKDEHRSLLKSFWLFQYLRTEAASRRSVEMMDAIAPAESIEGINFRMEIKDAVQIGMRTFADNMNAVSDLKVCLVRNRTRLPFITSDDPAVLSNRWHLQNPDKAGRSFGINKAGTLLFLPLNPQILFLAYDGDMYSVSHSSGIIDLKNERDTDAFNQHQYLNCCANIFVQEREHFSLIRDSFIRVKNLRPNSRHAVNYAILSKMDGEFKEYIVVDRAVAEQHEEVLIHSQSIHPTPAFWPSHLKWRSGASAYSNGTGAGFVRKSFAYSEDGPQFKRIKV